MCCSKRPLAGVGGAALVRRSFFVAAHRFGKVKHLPMAENPANTQFIGGSIMLRRHVASLCVSHLAFFVTRRRFTNSLRIALVVLTVEGLWLGGLSCRVANGSPDYAGTATADFQIDATGGVSLLGTNVGLNFGSVTLPVVCTGQIGPVLSWSEKDNWGLTNRLPVAYNVISRVFDLGGNFVEYSAKQGVNYGYSDIVRDLTAMGPTERTVAVPTPLSFYGGEFSVSPQFTTKYDVTIDEGRNVFLNQDATIESLTIGLDSKLITNSDYYALAVRQSIYNAGTFTSTGVTTATLDATFNNIGTVDVEWGTLRLAGSGTNSGRFNVASGATLEFAGQYNLDPGTTLTGLGTTRVNGGVTLNTTINAPGRFEMAGGVLYGSGQVNANGEFAWKNGTVIPTVNVASDATVNISGDGDKSLWGTINHAGSGTWTGNGSILLYGNTNGNLNILSGGVFEARNDATIGDVFSGYQATGAVNNAGTFRKNGGTGITSIWCGSSSGGGFNNTGTVDVQTGTLSIQTYGTNSGRFNVASGATLEFAGQYNLDPGTTLTGLGTTRVNGGVTLNTTINAPGRFEVAGGQLLGTNGANVNGEFAWTGGQVGTTINVGSGATLTISSDDDKSLWCGTINHAGRGTWTGNGAILVGSNTSGNLNILAGGVFEAQNDATIRDVAYVIGDRTAVNNAGTFRKNGGKGITTIGTGVAFNNSGTVEVQSGMLAFNGGFTQTAGATKLSGGAISSTGTLNILGGELSGSGTIDGSLLNAAGLVSPGNSPGTLFIHGDYTQNTAGSLLIEIAGEQPGVFDTLTISGNALLDGTLDIDFLNGFLPSYGDTFQILSFGSLTGRFADIEGLTFGSGEHFEVAYSPNGLTLTAVPEPDSLMLVVCAAMAAGVCCWKRIWCRMGDIGWPLCASRKV